MLADAREDLSNDLRCIYFKSSSLRGPSADAGSATQMTRSNKQTGAPGPTLAMPLGTPQRV